MIIETVEEAGDGIIVQERREGSIHRRVIYFGADISGEPDEVKAFAAGCGFVAKTPPAQVNTTVDDYANAVSWKIETVAQERGYSSAVACASYVNSTIPAWAAEAAEFLAWRDRVWVFVYAQMALAQSGQRQQPSVAALVAELPVMTWPT